MKQILSNDIINQYLPTLIKCPLFNKLGEPELRSYLHNAKVIVHSYKKNDFIMNFSGIFKRRWRKWMIFQN